MADRPSTLRSPSRLPWQWTGRGIFISPTPGISRVRKVSKEGIITTVAGTGTQGHSGDGGDARNAQIGYPFGLAVGPDGSVYIADSGYVRKVATDGVITTLAAASLSPGSAGGSVPLNVLALAVDSGGSVYATDHNNDRVLKISPGGVLTPYAGTGIRGFSGDGGPAGSAQLAIPLALAFDAADNLYIGEWGRSGNPRIRKVSSSGIISTIAGTGVYGYSGDGGLAASAMIGLPYHLAAGEHGEIYLADSPKRDPALTAGCTFRCHQCRRQRGKLLFRRDRARRACRHRGHRTRPRRAGPSHSHRPTALTVCNSPASLYV